MKVAVLGANGFIGSRVVELLHLSGFAEVIPVVRQFRSLSLSARFALPYRIADATDAGAVQKALFGCDYVIDCTLAQLTDIARAAQAVYEGANQAGVRRIVYLSSASVHGQAPRQGTDETTPLNAIQPLAYNRAKVKAERRLKYVRASGLTEVVVLRPGIVFGPRSRWIVDLADQLLRGDAYLIGNGHGICNCIYVDNLIEAIKLALHSPGIDGQAFLLGEREKVTWLDFYNRIANALGIDVASIYHLDVPSRSSFSPLITLGRAGSLDAMQLFEHFRASVPVQAVLPFVSSSLKRAFKAAISELSAEKAKGDTSWSLPYKKPPMVSKEMSMLQQCSYKLPIEKARRLLGYDATIPFDEGCRRSIGWLKFAGYPVLDECNTNLLSNSCSAPVNTQ